MALKRTPGRWVGRMQQLIRYAPNKSYSKGKAQAPGAVVVVVRAVVLKWVSGRVEVSGWERELRLEPTDYNTYFVIYW
ncbi:hypothetical protein ACRE_078940 [Hapsidospora chrysogenum ATCC 11550]|uniref:Uncharacterized protein n=1 Tax=Hapsidospora chrysogenum (strain ATCC 11550 / CBS 779.69 / DSM 880 / IAM 14645 / JCM 23072 / IMI 49137) TaxID=857340 RepID=A0A086SWB3_HAPC1|nr:hypothetical protein ACRE_078940 [Hapsidospora chrysogenum ATCC 11550]